MTACIRSKRESCGTRRITVDGADDDLRNALATASDVGWGPPETIWSPLGGITSQRELADPR